MLWTVPPAQGWVIPNQPIGAGRCEGGYRYYDQGL